MSPAEIAAAVAALALVAGGLLWWRRRRGRGASIRRDAPTTPADRPIRSGLGARLAAVFGAAGEETWSALEETLLAADVGVATTTALVEAVRARGMRDPAAAREVLRGEMRSLLENRDRSLTLIGRPAVILVVGVNGSGKTTTIAKLTERLQRSGWTPLIGAADTYRAAAGDQLRAWADRLGAPVVTGSVGADPAAVAHDAVSAARARRCDVVLVDTAGRLHDKRNLMDELGKVVRVLTRAGAAPDEVLLVVDGTTGQNALAQARAFTAAVGVTGIAVTKLDGTSRGGIVLAIERELGLPVKLVGVGEGSGDLRDFDPDEYLDALLEG